jgi:RimJ/RimL family protein N-acetyltransferase
MAGIPFLVGKKVYLRALTESDSEGSYPTWFNDADVCRWNSHHIFPYTPEDARAYIQQANSDHSRLVLAVVRSKDDVHIGNIALDRINYINRTAELTIVIGDRTCWGAGYGTEAARLICDHGFLALNLNRIACGTFEDNVGMRKLAECLGMAEEGRRRKAVYKLGRYVDIIEYGVLRSEYVARFNLGKLAE